MERSGTKLRRIQEQIFIDCRDAESYYESFKHDLNDHDFTEKQLAIYDELSFLISCMGWSDEYLAYCEKYPSEYVRI